MRTAKDRALGLIDWLRRVFSTTGREQEAAEREEYGVPDRGDEELRRERFGAPFVMGEAAETAEDELDSLRPPPDPSP